MTNPSTKIAAWDGHQTGQTLAEYALILALIAILAVLALLFLGGQITSLLSDMGRNV